MNHEKSPQLTEQELRVLQLAAQGLTNKKIASNLGIKPVTVEFHVKNIFRKLNVSSRVEAVVLAEKTGLV